MKTEAEITLRAARWDGDRYNTQAIRELVEPHGYTVKYEEPIPTARNSKRDKYLVIEGDVSFPVRVNEAVIVASGEARKVTPDSWFYDLLFRGES